MNTPASTILTRPLSITTCAFLASLVLSLHAGCSQEVPRNSKDTTANIAEAEPTTDWYFLVLETQIGPLSAEVLRRYTALGRFRPDTQVWSEDVPEWTNLDEAFPGLSYGGSIDAGTKWTLLLRQGGAVDEPLIPGNRANNEYTPQELNQYINQNQGLLQRLRDMTDTFGPELLLDTKDKESRLMTARKLSRLLSHDIQRAMAKGDLQRVKRDMAALCTLAHQNSISISHPDNREPINSAKEYFELPLLTSISIIDQVSQILLDPKFANHTEELKAIAVEHLTWITPEMRTTYQETPRYQNSPDRQLSTERQEMQSMTKELMGF